MIKQTQSYILSLMNLNLMYIQTFPNRMIKQIPLYILSLMDPNLMYI